MDGIREELIGRPRDIDVHFVTTRGEHVVAAPLVFMVASIRVLFEVFWKRCDVLHLNLSIRSSTLRKYLFAWLARRGNCKYVVHLHGASYDAFWDSMPKFISDRIAHLFMYASAVVVLGDYWLEGVTARVGNLNGRIYVLLNATQDPVGIAGKMADVGEAPVRILFLGELGPRKGSSVLVEALGLLDPGLDWVATLAGNGAVNATRYQVTSLGLSARVHVPGWVSGDEWSSLMRSADIFVLPSFHENLPMAVVEAFAFGKAVICTPVGSLRDIVCDGVTGVFVEPGDVCQLQKALEKLVVDRRLRVRLGASARQVFEEKLEVSSYVDRLTELWKSLEDAGTVERV